MNSQDCEDYPKTAAYVRAELIEVMTMPCIVTLMKRIGQLGRAEFRNSLTWGHGPRIKITHLKKAYGSFSPNRSSDILKIDRKSIVEEHEAGRGWARTASGTFFPMLGATLLHELVHWGDDQDGVDRDGEEGAEFEVALFGRVMYPCESCERNQKPIRRNTRRTVGWL